MAWAHNPPEPAPKLVLERRAAILAPLPPPQGGGLIALAPGEMWCKCGEVVPAGSTECWRCDCREWADPRQILGPDEYRES
jgi:hypothetical protein